MLRTFLLTITSALHFALVAQNFSDNLIEYPTEKSGDNFTILPISNSKQVAVIYKESVAQGFEYHIDWLDEAIKPISRDSLLLKSTLSQSYSHVNEDQAYHLLYSKTKGRFLCFSVGGDNEKIKITDGTLEGSIKINGMVGQGNMLYLHSNSGSRNFIITINLSDGTLNKFDPGKQLKMNLKFIALQRIGTANQHEIIYTYISGTGRESRFTYIRFNEKGERTDETVLHLQDPTKEHVLLSSYLSKTSHGEYISIGVYNVNNKNATSNGIYIAKFTDAGAKFIKYYNYLDIKNFLTYMSDHGESKTHQKKKAKEDRGQEFNMNFHAAIHPMQEWHSMYTFVGEFYYPTYRTYTTTSWVNGRPMMQTHTVFDGFQYTHAAITAFNETGDLLWSDAFELHTNYKPFTVQQFLTVNQDPSNEELDIYEPQGDELKIREYETDGHCNADERINILQRENNTGVVRQFTAMQYEHWYDNTFIMHGADVNRNSNTPAGVKKQWLHYLYKVSYE